MDSFDLSEQRIVQLEQIPDDIRCQIERGEGTEYALDLSLNRLRSINHIGVFEHVNQLDLSGNQVENVNGIQALRRLQTLDLSRNCIVSVDLLALLPALQVLKIAENSLTTIDSLQLLPQLRVVDASYNRISKWPPLAGLSLLETLDVSDNMLGSFTPPLSPTLFPSQLRRLSIARNQIDKLCGVACLGLRLPMLEFLAFDGNPIVFEVAGNCGQLEWLLATFFPSVPLSNDGGLTMSGRRHEEFTIPPHTLNDLKRVVLEGHEEALDEFLVTGSLAAQRIPEGTCPPPAAVKRPLPTQRQFIPNHTNDDCDKSLSHDNKMEIWKRIQEDRKAQLDQSGVILSSSVFNKDKSVRWGQDVADIPLQYDIRTPALTAADLAVPDPPRQVMAPLDESNVSVMTPLDTMFSEPSHSMKGLQHNGVENDTLVKKVKMLTEQVITMRKYMKIWIKREKLVRDASARKIQCWLRCLRRKFQLRQRILCARKRRQGEYDFRHCSSTLMQNSNCRGIVQGRMEAFSVQSIQSHVRGFLIRRRLIQFKKKHVAACKIQRVWREVLHDRRTILQGDWNHSVFNGTASKSRNSNLHRYLRGMIRCSRDVKQLQRICAVQDDAISYLWNNQVYSNSIDNTSVEKKIVRFQRVWRGHWIQKQFSNNNNGVHDKEVDSSPEVHSDIDVSAMKDQLERQASEIDMLKQQLQDLDKLVSTLAANHQAT